MPNDISISALSPAPPLGGRTSPPAAPARTNPSTERVVPNPSLRLEPSLGLVVITIAKTIGGMSEKKTFDHDNATSAYSRREDYRP